MSDLGRRVSALIDDRRRALADAVADRHYTRHPDLDRRFGAAGRAHCRRDAECHLNYLCDALAVSLPVLFAEYAAWAKIMLAARGVPAEDLAASLATLRDVLADELPADAGAVAAAYIEAGLRRLPQSAATLPGLLTDDAPHGELARRYLAALLGGERHRAGALIHEAAQAGTPIRDLYLHVFQRCQYEVGRLWQLNQITVAQEHLCTAATQMIMSQLYPAMFSGQKKTGRRLVAACVAGDLHEIGARMVADFLEMAGWDTTYIGANAPGSSLVTMLDERRADLLALSATMSFHIRAVADLIAEIRQSAIGPRVRILVGGYPFNTAPELWRDIGADGWARDADEAVGVADRLVAGRAP